MKLTSRQSDALGHIVDHCIKAAEAGANLTLEKLAADWQGRYLLIHCVLIVGEAATRLGPAVESAYPDVPWRKIIGMRHRLIHGYDDVDNITLWQTVNKDLPQLQIEVEKILAEAS